MTIRQCYEACLIELDKVQAPSLLLEDFNYLFNKAVQKYFNRRYSLFESNQQLTDDLRVLTKTVWLTETQLTSQNRAGDGHAFQLPDDYVHLLNCICEFQDITKKRCDVNNMIYRKGANKLTSNEWSQIITNYYMRPSVKQPYYYITNINDPEVSNIIKETEGVRYGNSSIPTIEIKCGELPSGTTLRGIYVEYLRAPQFLPLDIESLDKIDDDSITLEFPDYVIYEIINEMVTSVLENNKDPRIQTFPTVNNTITTPAKR